ncbi:RteC domain-containing protein [Aquimarina algicola]|nr:RteC domain-containing protein [Aquimarina algicola]
MRKQVHLKGFKTREEEIDFFKNIKSLPLSKLIYFKELSNLEYYLPKEDESEQKKCIKHHLKRINYFFSSNIDFGQYIEMEATFLDEHYFTRKFNEYSSFHNCTIFEIDSNFYTPKDTLFAQFKAYREFVIYLRKKLTTLSNRSEKTLIEQSNLKWTGNKIDLIELIYALHASGSIKAKGIKEVAKAYEELFEIDLGNYYRKFIELRNRKLIERTRFIDTLRDKLIQRIEEADQ